MGSNWTIRQARRCGVLLMLLVMLMLVVVRTCTATASVNGTVANFLAHRQKRGLIYPNSGTLKFSIGPSIPVYLNDPVSWRSLIYSLSLQGGSYSLPTEPIYPWDKWEDTFARSLKKVRQNFDDFGEYPEDDSRLFAYTALEVLMDSGGHGRACLLRSICENAQVDEHIGIFAELLNVVLTPGMESIDPIYKEAYRLGKSGVDCVRTYHNCPIGANILDSYLHHL